MLKKVLSVVGIIGGAALSTLGVVTLIKSDDAVCENGSQTTEAIAAETGNATDAE